MGVGFKYKRRRTLSKINDFLGSLLRWLWGVVILFVIMAVVIAAAIGAGDLLTKEPPNLGEKIFWIGAALYAVGGFLYLAKKIGDWMFLKKPKPSKGD